MNNLVETRNDSISEAARVEDLMASFLRPPVVRSGAAALNRALFTRKVDLAAATIQDPRLISKYRKALLESKELLRQEKISPVVSHPEDKADTKQGGAAGSSRKCLLLAPNVNAQGCRSRIRECDRVRIQMANLVFVCFVVQRLIRGALFSGKLLRRKT